MGNTKKVQAAQFYLSTDIYLQVKVIAERQGKPMAGWVRDLVLKELEQEKVKVVRFSSLPVYSWEKKKHSVSENIDKILYNAK